MPKTFAVNMESGKMLPMANGKLFWPNLKTEYMFPIKQAH
jgi:hypothetical protein